MQVLANLGQEIAQSNEVEVGDTADIVDDDPVTLPTIDEIPGTILAVIIGYSYQNHSVYKAYVPGC